MRQRDLAATAAGHADLVERSLLPAVNVAVLQYAPATIAERLHEYGVPGVSIAVIDGGAVAWARAYGTADLASGRAATTATLFEAASMSKPVASTAALQMLQEGVLALGAPVVEAT
jgi:CubicO group peptidase (beta-lactamase class C family)